MVSSYTLVYAVSIACVVLIILSLLTGFCLLSAAAGIILGIMLAEVAHKEKDWNAGKRKSDKPDGNRDRKGK